MARCLAIPTSAMSSSRLETAKQSNANQYAYRELVRFVPVFHFYLLFDLFHLSRHPSPASSTKVDHNQSFHLSDYVLAIAFFESESVL